MNMISCCTFENNTIDNEQNLFGTMLRIKDAGEVGDISKKLLSKKKFGVYDIVSSKNTEASYADMNRFYFLIRGKYLVCNLKGHRGIKGYYEAYINWLLKTQVYKFDPKISVPKDIKLSDIKNMTFGLAPKTDAFKKDSDNKKFRLFNIAKDMLSDLLKEQIDLKDIDLANVLTAKLILSFRKPRKMTEEEYQKEYGAVLKNIIDTDDIVFEDRKKRKIKGSTLERSKEVQIDTTENGLLNEADLQTEMTRFITELNNEDIN